MQTYQGFEAMIPKLPVSERVELAEMEHRQKDNKAGLVPCQP